MESHYPDIISIHIDAVSLPISRYRYIWIMCAESIEWHKLQPLPVQLLPFNLVSLSNDKFDVDGGVVVVVAVAFVWLSLPLELILGDWIGVNKVQGSRFT